MGEIEKNAKDVLERVQARNLKANILTNQGEPGAATAVSIETLALLGISLPDAKDPDALGPAIGEAFGVYQVALGGRDVTTLRNLPIMTDPQQLALVDTISSRVRGSRCVPDCEWSPSRFPWS